mgnify:CR=1 FL=1
MSLEFLLTSFLVCLAPGIGVVFTLSTTLGQGLRGGLWAAIGCTLATLAHLIVAMAGLAAVLHGSAVLFQTLKFAGAAYLLWMAWGALTGSGGLELRASAPQSAGRLVWRGVLLSILNPKLPMFFMAFLPQFMTADLTGLASLQEMAALGSAFALITFATFVLYAMAAASGRNAVLTSERLMAWLRRAFAASFAALGLRLALERA